MSSTIFAGQGLGLLDSSLGKIDRNDRTSEGKSSGGATAINTANGNLVFRSKDAFLKNTGIDFSLFNTYNSKAKDWRFSFEVAVEFDATKNEAYVVYGDGTRKTFTFDAVKNAYVSEDGNGANEELRQEAGLWQLTTSDRSTWKFNSQNQLAEKLDEQGHQTRYFYLNGKLQRIFASNDHVVKLEYNAQNLLESVIVDVANEQGSKTPTQLAYYQYHTSGQLKSTKDRAGHVTSYEYNSDGLLKTITYPKTQTVIEDGVPVVKTDNKARSKSFEYELSPNQALPGHVVSSYTDEAGNKTTFTYGHLNQVGGELDVDQAPDNAYDNTARDKAPSWNKNISYVGGDKVVYQKALWQASQTAQQSDVPGTSTVWEKIEDLTTMWDTLYQRPSNNAATTPENSWLTSTISVGRTTMVNALGNNRATSNEQEFVKWRTENGYYGFYNATNTNISNQKDRILAEHSLTYSYDAQGNIVEVADQNGYHTVYEYQGDDLHKVFSAEGWALLHSNSEYHTSLRKELGYTDATGNFGKTVAELSENERAAIVELFTSTYNYENGNLVSHVEGDGSTTTYKYSTTNKLEETTTAEGHALANLNDERYQARRQELGFSADANLLTAEDKTTLLALHTTTFEYDLVTDQLTRKTIGVDFNASGADSTKPSILAEVTEYRYYTGSEAVFAGDKGALHQEVVYLADGRQQITTYQYDLLGNVSELTTADKADGADTENLEQITTVFDYDEFGNLLSKVDGNGGTTSMVYDADNRLRHLTDAKGFTTTYDYDAVGNIIATTDAQDNVTSRVYSSNNLLLSETQHGLKKDDNRTVHYKYNVLGQKTSFTDARASWNAEKYTTTYEYDGFNQLVKVTTPKVDTIAGVNQVTTNYTIEYGYNGNNQKIWEKDANGYVTNYLYNSDGLLVAKESPAGHITRFQYNHNGQLIQTIDGAQLATNKQQITKLFYDDENQLIRTIDAEGLEQVIKYDEIGNKVATIRVAGQQTSQTIYEYDLQNRLVKEKHPEAINVITGQLEAAEKSIAYDGNNNVISTTDENGNQVKYYYDANNNRILKRDIGVYQDQNEQLKDVFTSYSFDELNQNTAIRINVLVATDATGEPIYLGDGAYTRPNPVEAWVKGKTYIVGDQVKHADHIWEARNWTDTQEPGAVGSRVWMKIQNVHPLYETINDENAEITTFGYNEFGELVEQVNPMGHKLIMSNAEFYQQYRLELEAKDNLLTGAGGKDFYEADVAQLSTQNKDKLLKAFTTTFKYDKAGNVLEREEATYGELTQNAINNRRNKTLFEYDGLNRVIREENERWKLNRFWYDGNGNVIKKEDGQGDHQFFSYDDQGRLLDTAKKIYIDGKPIISTSPTGTTLDTFEFSTRVVSSNFYDGFGNLVKQVKAHGSAHQTAVTFEYDNMNRLLKSTNEEGHSKHIQYDAFGRRWKEFDYRQKVTGTEFTEYGYDARDRVIKVIDPFKNETKFEFDAVGNTIRVRDPRNHDIQFVFDAANRKTQTIQSFAQGETRISEMEYDAFGREIISRVGAGTNDEVVTRFVYDAAGNLVKVLDALNNTITHKYDQSNNVLETKDQNGNVSKYIYNDKGQIHKQINAENHEVVYVDYHADGDLMILQELDGEQLHFQYDPSNKLITTSSNKDSLETKFMYDAKENRTKIIYANGLGDQKTINFEYYADGKIYRQYDASIENEQQKNTGTSTNPNNPGDSSDQNNQTGVDTKTYYYTEYEYDEQNNVVVERDQNGFKTRYTYDSLNRVSTIRDPEGNLTEYVYDETGNRVQVIVGGEVKSTTIYNEANQVQFQIDGEGYVTEFRYSATGAIEETILFNNAVAKPLLLVGSPNVSTELEALVNQLDRTSVKSHVSNIFDELGRVTYSIDGELGYSKFEYDNVGNIVGQTTFKAPLNSRYSDTINKVLWSKSELDATTAGLSSADKAVVITAYDKINQVRFKLSAEGYLTEIKYDAAGNVTDRIQYEAKYASLEAAFSEISKEGVKKQHTAFEYDHKERLTKETSALGIVTEYRYDNFGNRTHKIEALGTDKQRTTFFAYNRANHLTDEYKAYGTVNEVHTKYEVDPAGRVASKVEAFGTPEARTTEYQYYSNNRLKYEIRSIDGENTLTTLKRYDAAGNLTKEISGTYIAQDRSGRLGLSGTDFREVNLKYDANNRLTDSYTLLDLDRTYPQGGGVNVDVRTERHDKYEYDAAGNKVTATYAVGEPEQRSESWLYDNDKRLERYTDGVGTETLYQYNGYDYLVTEIKGDNTTKAQIWNYEYDKDGRQVKIISPESTQVVTHRGPISVNNTTMFVYDAFGNATEKHTGVGTDDVRITRYEFDLLNRKTAEVLGDNIKGSGSRTEFKYDSLNRLTERHSWVRTDMTVDVNGKFVKPESLAVERYWYNLLDHRTEMLSAQGYLTVQTFNNHGQILSRKQYKTTYSTDATGQAPTPAAGDNPITTTWEYTQGGKVQAENGPIARTEYDYNKFGDQVEVREAVGTAIERATQFTYDHGGRLSSETTGLHATRVGEQFGKVQFEYNSKDAITTGYEYDQHGQTIVRHDNFNADTQAYSAKTSYRYDDEGRQTHVINHDVTMLQGSVSSATQAKVNLLELKVYDAHGNLSKVSKGTLEAHNEEPSLDVIKNADSITKYSYNKENRIVAKYLGKGDVSETYVYDTAGNRISILNGNTKVTKFEYDLENRQKRIIEGDNFSNNSIDPLNPNGKPKGFVAKETAFEYDSQGNLVAKTLGSRNNTSTERYSYYEDGKLKAVVSAKGILVKQLQYDELGNVTKEINGNDIATVREFDDGGRLDFEIVAGQFTTEHQYDELGRLINQKTSAVNGAADLRVTTYAYDLRGNRTDVTNAEGYTDTYIYNWQNQVTDELLGQYLVESTDTLNFSQTLKDNEHVTKKSYVYNEVGNQISETSYLTTSTGSNEEIVNWYLYDNAGNRIEEWIAFGNDLKAAGPDVLVNAWKYNEAGLVKTQDVGGIYSYFSYDPAGLLRVDVQLSDDRQTALRETYFDYDSAGRQQVIKKNVGFENGVQLITKTYDEQGNLQHEYLGDEMTDNGLYATQDPYQQLTRYNYDADGHLESIDKKVERNDGTFALVPQKKFVVDNLGNIIRETSFVQTENQPQGTFTEVHKHNYYNKLNQLTHVVDAKGYVTENVYDSYGNLKETTKYNQPVDLAQVSTNKPVPAVDESKGGLKIVSTYNELNHKLTQTQIDINHPQGFVIVDEWAYNSAGLVTEHIEGSGTAKATKTENEYDSLGRLVLTTQSVLNTSDYPSTANNTPVSTKFEYNELNQVTAKYEGYRIVGGYRGGSVALYERLTETEYNKFGLVERETILPGTSSYNSELETKIVNAYVYDGIGQMTAKVVGRYDEAVDWVVPGISIDSKSSIKNISADQVTTYSYNKLGQLREEVRGTPTEDTDYQAYEKVTYQYDYAGNKSAEIIGDSIRVDYVYNELNQLEKKVEFDKQFGSNALQPAVGEFKAYVTEFKYDYAGNLISETNGLEYLAKFDQTEVDKGTLETLTKVATAPKGVTTQYFYDQNSNLVFKKLPDNRYVRFEHDENGNVVKEVAYSGIDKSLTAKQTQTSSFKFDEFGRLTTEVNTGGTRKVHQYDVHGQIESTLIGFDNGLGAKEGDFSGTTALSEYGYDYRGNQIEIIDPAGIKSVIHYDYLGNQRQVTTGMKTARAAASVQEQQQVIKFDYNSAGQLVLMREAGDLETAYKYDGAGNRIEEIQAYGTPSARSIVTEYSLSGRKIKQISAGGSVSEFKYSNDGNLVEKTFWITSKVVEKLDETGKPVVDANGTAITEVVADRTAQTLYAYDGRGNKAYEIEKLNDSLVFNAADAAPAKDDIAVHTFELVTINEGTADEKQQLQQVVKYLKTFAYNANGDVSSTNVEVSFSEYNSRGLLAKEGKGLGSHQTITSYEYNGNGEKTKQTDGSGTEAVVTEFKYDGFGNNYKLIKAGLVSYFLHDDNGNVIGSIDPNGNAVRYTFDSQGRTTLTRIYAEKIAASYLAELETLDYGFAPKQDFVPVLEAVSDPTSVSYKDLVKEYDAAGNVTKEAINYVSKAADAQGIETTISIQDYLKSIELNSLSKVVSETEFLGDVTTTEVRDETGAVVSTDTSSAIDEGKKVSSYIYDGAGRLYVYLDSDYNLNGRGQVVVSQYDIFNNKTLEQIHSYHEGEDSAVKSGRVTYYSYDADNRLQMQLQGYDDGEFKSVQTFVYDLAGNRVQLIEGGSALRSVSTGLYDALIAGTEESTKYFDYYANGQLKAERFENVSTVSNGVLSTAGQMQTSYLYDSAGQQIAKRVHNDSSVATWGYQYNSLGQLEYEVLPTVEVYRYDNAEIVQDWSAVDTANGINIQHEYDAVGYETQVTDADGNQVTKWYDANGREVAVMDANGGLTISEFNAFNVQTKEIRFTEAVPSNSRTLDFAGLQALTASVANVTTTYIYNDVMQLIETRSSSKARVATLAQPELTVTTSLTDVVELFEYDDFGNQTTVTQKDGSKLYFEYDHYGRTLAQTDADGYVVEFVYDSQSNVVKEIKHETVFDPTALYEYVVVSKDASGNDVTKTFNESGLAAFSKSRAQAADREVTNRVYNQINQLVSESTSGTFTRLINNHLTDVEVVSTTTYEYDARGNMVAKTMAAGEPEAETELFFFDQANRQVYYVNSRGIAIENDYDKAGNLVRTTRYAKAISVNSASTISQVHSAILEANGIVNATTNERVISAVNQQETTFVYNSQGRVQQQTKLIYNTVTGSTESYSTTYKYDGRGNKTYERLIDRNAAEQDVAVLTRTAFDGNNNVVLQEDPGGVLTSTTIDVNGNQTSAVTGGFKKQINVDDLTVSLESISNSGIDLSWPKITDAVKVVVYWGNASSTAAIDSSDPNVLKNLANNYPKQTTLLPSDFSNAANFRYTIPRVGSDTTFVRVVAFDKGLNAAISGEYSFEPPVKPISKLLQPTATAGEAELVLNFGEIKVDAKAVSNVTLNIDGVVFNLTVSSNTANETIASVVLPNVAAANGLYDLTWVSGDITMTQKLSLNTSEGVINVSNIKVAGITSDYSGEQLTMHLSGEHISEYLAAQEIEGAHSTFERFGIRFKSYDRVNVQSLDIESDGTATAGVGWTGYSDLELVGYKWLWDQSQSKYVKDNNPVVIASWPGSEQDSYADIMVSPATTAVPSEQAGHGYVVNGELTTVEQDYFQYPMGATGELDVYVGKPLTNKAAVGVEIENNRLPAKNSYTPARIQETTSQAVYTTEAISQTIKMAVFDASTGVWTDKYAMGPGSIERFPTNNREKLELINGQPLSSGGQALYRYAFSTEVSWPENKPEDKSAATIVAGSDLNPELVVTNQVRRYYYTDASGKTVILHQSAQLDELPDENTFIPVMETVPGDYGFGTKTVNTNTNPLQHFSQLFELERIEHGAGPTYTGNRYGNVESIEFAPVSLVGNKVLTAAPNTAGYSDVGARIGYVNEYIYNDFDQVIATNENTGQWRTFELDINGNAVATHYWADSASALSYVNGNTGNASAQAGYQKSEYATYDNRGNKLLEWGASELSTEYATASTHGTAVAAVEARLTTTRKYDHNSRLTEQTLSDNRGTTTYQYNIFGKVTKETNGAKVTNYFYDLMNREIAKVEGDKGTFKLLDKGAVTQERLVNGTTVSTDVYRSFGIDDLGRMTSTIKAKDASSTITANYAYDTFDRVVRVERGEGMNTYYTIDARGNQVSIKNASGINAAGDVLTQVFDAAGNIIRTSRPSTIYGSSANATTESRHDVMGNLIYSRDAAGVITTKEYGKNGRVEREVLHKAGTGDAWRVTEYDYNESGQVTAERIKQVGKAQVTVNNVYDDLGRLTSVTKGAQSATYKYDQAGNRTFEEVKEGSTTLRRAYYTYDQQGNLTAWTQDVINNRSNVSLGSKVAIQWDYNASGHLAEVRSYENGTLMDKEKYFYDETGQLNKVEVYSGATLSRTDTYDYNRSGVLQRVVKSDVVKGDKTYTYTYDAAGRLTDLDESGNGKKAHWDYNHLGKVTTYKEETWVTWKVDSGEKDSDDKPIMVSTPGYQETSRTTYSLTDDGRTRQTVLAEVTYDGTTGSGGKVEDVVTTTIEMNGLGRTTKSTTLVGDTNYYTKTSYLADGKKHREWTDSGMDHAKTTYTRYSYDANGGLDQIKIDGNQTKAVTTKKFVTDIDGKIISRHVEGGATRETEDDNFDPAKGPNGSHGVYFYANGKQVGKYEYQLNDEGYKKDNITKELGTGSFRLVQNPDAETIANTGGSLTSFTAQGGETLQQLAANLFGNANMWFLLAEANGLSGSEPLQEGQVLTVPQGLDNAKVDTEAHKQYSEGEIIGSTAPSLKIQPPKPKWWQKLLAVVITIIIVAAVTYLTAGLGSFFAGSAALAGLGTTAATVVGYAVAGALVSYAASYVKQGLMMAIGMQEPGEWDHTGAQKDALFGAISGAAQGFGAAAKLKELADPVRESLRAAQSMTKIANTVLKNIDFENGGIKSWTSIAATFVGEMVGLDAEFGAIAEKGIDAAKKTVETVNTIVEYASPWLSVIEQKGLDFTEWEGSDWVDAIGGTISVAIGDMPGMELGDGLVNDLKEAANRTIVAATAAGFMAAIDREAAGDFLTNFTGEQLGGALSTSLNRGLKSWSEGMEADYAADIKLQEQAMAMNRQLQATVIDNLHSEMGLTDAQREQMQRRMADGEYDLTASLAKMQEGVNGKFGEDGITINQKLAQQAANDPEMAAKLLGTYVEELTHAIAASIENGEDLPFDEGAIVASAIMKDLTSQEGAIQFAIDTGEGFEMFATDGASIGAVHDSMYPVERLYADVTVAGTEYSMDFVGPEGGAVIDPTSLVAAFMGELNDRFNPNLYRGEGQLPSLDGGRQYDTATPYEQLLPEDVANIRETMLALGVTDEQMNESMNLLMNNVTEGFIENFDSAYGALSGEFIMNPYARQDFFNNQMTAFGENLAELGLDANQISWDHYGSQFQDLAIPQGLDDINSMDADTAEYIERMMAREDLNVVEKFGHTWGAKFDNMMDKVTEHPLQLARQTIGGASAVINDTDRVLLDMHAANVAFAASDDPDKWVKAMANISGDFAAGAVTGGAGIASGIGRGAMMIPGQTVRNRMDLTPTGPYSHVPGTVVDGMEYAGPYTPYNAGTTTTVYRVDDNGYAPRISSDGSIPSVTTKKGNERALFVNFDQPERAKEFAQVNRNGDATITAAEVDHGLLDRLRATSVHDLTEASSSGSEPLRVDIKAIDQYGLRTPEHIDLLRDAIDPSTVRIVDPEDL